MKCDIIIYMINANDLMQHPSIKDPSGIFINYLTIKIMHDILIAAKDGFYYHMVKISKPNYLLPNDWFEQINDTFVSYGYDVRKTSDPFCFTILWPKQ